MILLYIVSLMAASLNIKHNPQKKNNHCSANMQRLKARGTYMNHFTSMSTHLYIYDTCVKKVLQDRRWDTIWTYGTWNTRAKNAYIYALKGLSPFSRCPGPTCRLAFQSDYDHINKHSSREMQRALHRADVTSQHRLVSLSLLPPSQVNFFTGCWGNSTLLRS
jgi:hypothetical protein